MRRLHLLHRRSVQILFFVFFFYAFGPDVEAHVTTLLYSSLIQHHELSELKQELKQRSAPGLELMNIFGHTDKVLVRELVLEGQGENLYLFVDFETLASFGVIPWRMRAQSQLVPEFIDGEIRLVPTDIQLQSYSFGTDRTIEAAEGKRFGDSGFQRRAQELLGIMLKQPWLEIDSGILTTLRFKGYMVERGKLWLAFSAWHYEAPGMIAALSLFGFLAFKLKNRRRRSKYGYVRYAAKS